MLILTALVALAYLVWRVPDVLTTAVGGIALALVLSFPVRFLSRFMPRGLSILLSFLLVVGLFVLAVLYLVPLVVEQFASLVSALPEIANTLGRYLQNTPSFLQSRGFLPGDAEQIITGLRDELANAAQAVAGNGLSGAFGFFVTLFGVIFIGAYLLVDVRRVEATFLRAVPTATGATRRPCGTPPATPSRATWAGSPSCSSSRGRSRRSACSRSAYPTPWSWAPSSPSRPSSRNWAPVSARYPP